MKKKRILVIGGSVRSAPLLGYLASSGEYEVAAVADTDSGSKLMQTARQNLIPTTDSWDEFIKSGKCDVVLDLTGNQELSEKIKSLAARGGIEVMGEVTARLIWVLLRQSWARDVFDRLQAKIDPSWSLDEILILLLEGARKLTSASSGVIFTGKEDKIENKISWGIGEEKFRAAFGNIRDLNKMRKNFYEFLRPNIYIPFFENEVFSGGVLLFSVRKDRLDDKIIGLIQTKISSIIFHTKTLHKTIKLSNLDGLTELFNHRSFHERLEKEIYRAQQYDLNFSLLMMDIDDFKKLNDTYGHLAGDQHLRSIARILKFILRETDFVARYGGEEFAVILPETPLEGARSAAERIRSSVENQDFGKNIRVTLSIGVSSYPDHGVKKNDLIEKADKALYKAKELGKNRVCVAE